MTRLRRGGIVLVVMGALLPAACGGGTPNGAPPSAATSSGTSITVSNFMFSPVSLSVQPGATVSVTNQDGVTHTLTATGGQFDTGNIGPHQTKTFTAPTRPGTYHYICGIHQYMMGTLRVKDPPSDG